jgi:SagB-type dehydrogenase family enzyme
MNRQLTASAMAMIFAAGIVCSASAQLHKTIILPPPDTSGGMPLMKALKHRQSAREFSDRELSDTLLGNLLWAATGVNRPEEGKRTAPSAHNNQDVDVYVAMKRGLYRYLPGSHSLALIDTLDIRGVTGKQGFVEEAPVDLVFVADYAKSKRVDKPLQPVFAAAHTGYISQNVYLFCAAFGLATVARTWFEEPKVTAALKLAATQKPILTQTVGYPRE